MHWHDVKMKRTVHWVSILLKIWILQVRALLFFFGNSIMALIVIALRFFTFICLCENGLRLSMAIAFQSLKNTNWIECIKASETSTVVFFVLISAWESVRNAFSKTRWFFPRKSIITVNVTVSFITVKSLQRRNELAFSPQKNILYNELEMIIIATEAKNNTMENSSWTNNPDILRCINAALHSKQIYISYYVAMKLQMHEALMLTCAYWKFISNRLAFVGWLGAYSISRWA